MQTFEDVMFDTEAMDLAESFADLPEAIEAVIISDEEPQEGEEIYFGLPRITSYNVCYTKLLREMSAVCFVFCCKHFSPLTL